MRQVIQEKGNSNGESTWRNSLFLVTCMFIVSLFSLAGAGSVLADERFKIEEAKYKQEDNRLKIKGKAKDDAEVQLFDADSGVSFATVSADDDMPFRAAYLASRMAEAMRRR